MSVDTLRTQLTNVEFVEIAELLDGFSPRLDGINPQHARQLADLADELPPILVQRSSMRVVDGMHRLHAARLRDARLVPVTFFEGSDDEAFLAAVRLNAAHGMPLSTGDRAAAAERILRSHSHWSDRRIASTCGVAPRTVAALRLRSADDGARLNTRVGRDGRRHPVSSEVGRQTAADLMRRDPTASLRTVARQSGISVGTALDVRRRMATADADRSRPATEAPAPPQARPLLERLVHDPSLRYNERGRALLRLVSATLAFADQSEIVAEAMPGHCRDTMRMIAQLCADGWQTFGHRIDGARSVCAVDA